MELSPTSDVANTPYWTPNSEGRTSSWTRSLIARVEDQYKEKTVQTDGNSVDTVNDV
ncbi:uncharacterized protein CTRU02_213003 [Colletotrichum truncatum]|uniref:Uncharacterized protein n=1 Tax=Colletotrichum truncatum TaxID=5467 RepID=A0ACC3YJI4_COLTU|nr:uncharacterized protein CTRU02_03323 [Colletotrichum truncatum]KAF6797292.1 hypothetical protein CTRU02_03323 [Colletotrichum truncatum]